MPDRSHREELSLNVMTSQGAIDERLERCAIELWAVDNRVRGMGEDNWDALGWGDRRDYRWMAAAVLREAGIEGVPTEDEIAAAADHKSGRCGSCGRFLGKDSYYTNRCANCWGPEDEFLW